MEMLWFVVGVVAVIAVREFVFVPFKQNPYEYTFDEEGNEIVKDNTTK